MAEPGTCPALAVREQKRRRREGRGPGWDP